MKLLGMLLVVVGLSSVALANYQPAVPEIDPTSILSALSLLGGLTLVARSRRSS